MDKNTQWTGCNGMGWLNGRVRLGDRGQTERFGLVKVRRRRNLNRKTKANWWRDRKTKQWGRDEMDWISLAKQAECTQQVLLGQSG